MQPNLKTLANIRRASKGAVHRGPLELGGAAPSYLGKPDSMHFLKLRIIVFVCVLTWKPEGHLKNRSIPFLPYLRQSVFAVCYSVPQDSWLPSFRGFSCLFHLNEIADWVLQVLGFMRHLNSGPHTWAASAFPTELSSTLKSLHF